MPEVISGLNGGFIKKVDTISQLQTTDKKSADLNLAKKDQVKKSSSKAKPQAKIEIVKNEKHFSVKRVLIGLSVAVIILLIFSSLGFSGAVFAHQYQTHDKSLHGVSFMGEELGGLTKADLVNKISKKLSEINLVFEIEGEPVSFKIEEAGITFDENIIASEAYSYNKSNVWHQEFLGSSLSLINQYLPIEAAPYLERTRKSVALKYQINEVKLTEFIEELSKKYHIEEKNASLVMNGTDVQVIPAVYGKQLVTGAIRTQIQGALDKGEVTKIAVNVEEVDPKILETDVQTSISEAQAILKNTVTLTYKDKTFVPAKSVIGGWVAFKEINGVLKPIVDTEKVKTYVSGVVARDINIAPINEKVKITNGAKREQVREGVNGLSVNVNSLATDISFQLNANQSFKSTVPTYAVKYKTEVNNVLVANWDKYIEVSIARQEMCAYLRGGTKVNCWKITTGAASWPTPRGTFLIQRKSGAGGQSGMYGGGVCMPNPPSTTPLCGINYVSYFTSAGHAIHEAWWRSSSGYNAFGNANYAYNGSHGCINSPYDVARFIYNWAPIGTPVIIH